MLGAFAAERDGAVDVGQRPVEIRQLLVSEDVPILTAEVQRRHLYVTSVATGQAGHEMPGAHAAKKEMTRLWDEIEAKAKLKTHAKPQVAAHV